LERGYNNGSTKRETSVAPKTLQRYREIVDLHLVPVLGVLPLAKLQPAHVQIYYSQALVAGRRNGKRGLLAQTVVHHHRVLHVALKRARALRLISTNPVEDASRPVVQRHEIEALEPAESAALLNATRATRMFPIIFLALATGLRWRRGPWLALVRRRSRQAHVDGRAIARADQVWPSVQDAKDKTQPPQDLPIALARGRVEGVSREVGSGAPGAGYGA
jgi:integrase